MSLHVVKAVILSVLFAVTVMAQDRQASTVTSVFATLTTSVDSRTATVGQQLTLRTFSDVVVRSEVLIPNGSTIVAHVSDVRQKGKNQSQSALAIIVDNAKRADGIEIPLQAIIAAVAAPKDGSLSSDPTYAMLHSNEPTMSGGAGTTSRSGELSPASKATTSAAVATAGLKGRMDEPLLLTENSAGAIGYEGLELSWGLAAPPPFTIFVSKAKSIKLNAGTQVLLRMAPPHLPQ